ncbi:DnaE-like DNA polymerase III [Nocardia phage P3.1]|nr:DnaE-like DNA polymerase III [Nocardia phage P3.1]
MRYVSLHTHSTFSYGDGYGPVKDHVQRVAGLGMKALALTEHGNTSSHVQLEKACKGTDVKPIYGLEAYCSGPKESRKFHQTIVPMNEDGLRNLNRIVSRSWKENFYRWPTVSSSMLAEHNEGLIVTSGCADSLLSCTLLGGKSLGPKRLAYTDLDFDNAIKVIRWYQKIFGDRYYLEVQRFPGLERTRVLNPAFALLAEETGAKLVATCDVHYPLPTDNEMQKILHAAHRGGTVETAEADWEYNILLTYPTSDAEIHEDLVNTGLTDEQANSAIDATAEIAERCNVELPKNEPIKWEYDKSKFKSIEDYTWEQLRKGWEFRIKSNRNMRRNKKQYMDRIKYEMERIVPRGFCDYFAMLSYLVVWAKEQKIPVGPARGSAAASLVCYLLRITEVDPLQHSHMMFERFIDPKRLDLPDVDLDFADDRRDEVRQEAVRVFGADRVGNIGNFTRYKGKNSIDDVARVYNIPKWAAEEVKKLIIERSGGDSRASDTLEDTFVTFENARKVADQYPDILKAVALEGNYRGLGVHAAGLVISNTPITETCAMYTRESNGREISVVAYDKKDAEYLGMLKADFLGLSTMGMIGIALDIIGMDLEDLYRVPLDEPRTLAAFKKNDVTGIFQFEGRATRLVCGDVSPDNFQQLADINALSRPGPLFSGMTAQYVEVKHGRATAELLHPIVDEQTAWTYGQIVYQEQVLTIIRDLGGFPVQRVGDIRKIISQKLGEASFQAMWEEFRDGAARLHGVPEDLALRIWRFMVTSATYSFNVAHCVSYSMLAFWQQWIKQHHPTAFYAAQLTKVGDGKDQLTKRGKLMQDAIRHGQTIAPPDLELSKKGWVADVPNNRVVAGFTQIAGIGPKMADRVMEWRDSFGPKEPGDADLEWEDLIEVKGIGEKTIARITDFCKKDDPFDLELVGNLLGRYRKMLFEGHGEAAGVPMPTHISSEIPKVAPEIIWMGMVRAKNYQDYVENQRTRTGREVEDIIATMKDPHLTKSCVLQCYDDGDEDVYVRFNRWTFPRFEKDLEELIPGQDLVVVTGMKRDDFGVSLHVKDMVIIDTTYQEDEDAEVA